MTTRNMFASFVAGQQAGHQARQFQQQQEDRNAFRTLAPRVMAGDLAAYEQLGGISPEKANAVQGVADSSLRRTANALGLMRQAIDSGDLRRKQSMFQTVSPHFTKLTGKPAPEGGWTDEMLPAFEQLEAQVKAKVAGLPATQAEQFTLAPGSKRFDGVGNVIAEVPFSPANAQYVDVPDGRGGSVKMIFDPRTRQLVEPSYGGMPYVPPTGIQQGVNGPYTLAPDLTPEQVAAAQVAEATGSDEVQLPSHDVSPREFRGGLGYTPPKPQEETPETFSQPQVVVNPQTGQRELVQFGNRGGRRLVGDYAPEPAKGEGAGGQSDAGLNDRQRVAVKGVQRNLVQYASALTEIPVEQLQRMSAQEIARAVQEKGGRFVQGGVARVMGNLPGGQTAAQVQNSDILSYSQGAGAAWAGYENPTGIITNADRESATAQMPNYLDPPEVQAAKIRSFLELSGWDDRNGRQAPSAQEGESGSWGIREIK